MTLFIFTAHVLLKKVINLSKLHYTKYFEVNGKISPNSAAQDNGTCPKILNDHFLIVHKLLLTAKHSIKNNEIDEIKQKIKDV